MTNYNSLFGSLLRGDWLKVSTERQPSDEREMTERRNKVHDRLRSLRAPHVQRMLRFVAAFLLLLTIGVGNVWGTDASVTFSNLYSENTTLDGTAINIVTTGITATFNKKSGGTATQYYTNGTAVRWYGGGTLAISSSIGNITAVNITYTQTANSVSANVGSYSLSNSVGSWSGNASSVTFTQSGTSGHCRISEIQVTYTPAVACSNKVTLAKGFETNGTFTLNKTNGSYDNCDANFEVIVSNITPTNSSYYCTGVTATGGNSEVSNPDEDGNYTVTYTKGNNITSTITANFALKVARTVTFMNNGVQYGDIVNLYDGDAVGTLPSGPSSCATGKVFVGWSETEIGVTPTDDAPTFISASTIVSGGNKVYHAVFAIDDTPQTPLFKWDGGVKANLPSGVASTGLGKGYADTHSPYQIQLDDTGDNIKIGISGAPATVSVGVKMIGGNTASSITIKEAISLNSTFTDVQTLSISGNQNSTHTLVTTNAFKPTTRAVQLYFNKGANVGLGPITITPAPVYSKYVTGCCTSLGGINGSVEWGRKRRGNRAFV